MSAEGKHFGSSDEVRGYGRALAQSLQSLMAYNRQAKGLLDTIESADKGGSYQEGRRILEEVLSTVNNGFPAIEDTYKKLNAYADYLESIGK
jgi:hypothetical protein